MFDKSYHQHQVESFMLRAGQRVPVVPTIPTRQERERMVRLVFEEAFELADALSVRVLDVYDRPIDLCDIKVEATGEYIDLPYSIDSACDLRVVTTCVLSGCGIPDVVFQAAVDNNNLQKFGPGHTIRKDGKLIKPPDHQPPRIAHLLDLMFPGCLG